MRLGFVPSDDLNVLRLALLQNTCTLCVNLGYYRKSSMKKSKNAFSITCVAV